MISIKFNENLFFDLDALNKFIEITKIEKKDILVIENIAKEKLVDGTDMNKIYQYRLIWSSAPEIL